LSGRFEAGGRREEELSREMREGGGRMGRKAYHKLKYNSISRAPSNVSQSSSYPGILEMSGKSTKAFSKILSKKQEIQKKKKKTI
jgi:hypothetical protein